MDKEKLEEYRAKLEELLPSMEISFKDADKIAEYEKRLEELEQPIDMSDVGSATIVDRRQSVMEPREYSNDEEGRLLSQLDEERLHESIDVKKISEMIEQIRAIRENKRETERTSISSILEHVKRQEELYYEIFEDALQVKEQITKKQEELSKLQEKTEKLKQDEKELATQIGDNITIMGMKKPESMVYQSASKENAKLIASKRGKLANIRKNEKQITKLEQELTGLRDDFQELDNFMHKLSIKQKNIEKPEQEKPEQKEPEPKEPKQEKPQQEGKTQNPSHGQTAQRQTGTLTHNNPTTRQAENTIKQINFTIKNGNLPCYTVVIVDKNGQEQIRPFTGFEYINTVDYEMKQDPTSSIEKELEEKGLDEARRFYDKGLVEILSQVDAEFGTKGVQEYENMIRNKYQQAQIEETAKLSIDYDFSGLHDKISNLDNKEKLKSLQKIAKSGQNVINQIATYQKAPNILQKFWNRIHTKLLTGEVENIENEKMQQGDTMEYKENSEIMDLIEKNYQALRDEEGFDINTFIKSYDLDAAQAEKYKKMQQDYEAQTPRQSWKESLKQKVEPIGRQIKQRTDPVQKQVSKRVNSFMDDKQNKEDSKSDMTDEKSQQYGENQEEER